jgi:hypothetical protein
MRTRAAAAPALNAAQSAIDQEETGVALPIVDPFAPVGASGIVIQPDPETRLGRIRDAPQGAVVIRRVSKVATPDAQIRSPQGGPAGRAVGLCNKTPQKESVAWRPSLIGLLNGFATSAES